MAFEVISVNQTSTYSVDNSDTVTLMGGVTLTSASDGFDATGSGGVGIDSSRLNILGTVVSDGIGIDFYYSPIEAVNDVTVYIGATGEVHSSGDGIIMDSGADNSITNNGLITFGSFGLYFRSGTDNLIENHGQLLAVTSGVSTPSAAVFLGIGGSASLVNTGLISGGTASGLVWNFGTTSNIFNSGEIIATFGDAFNDGGSGDDAFINQGLIRGDINLGGGTDTFNGLGGTVFGTISGGYGDDIFIIDDATINLIENASQGTDTVKTAVSFRLGDNFENLTLLSQKNINGVGNVLANSIIGNAGDNRLQGDKGDDTINGAHGDDKLLGSFGLDTLLGGKGDDILLGGLDSDTLLMGNGNDVGYGGKGNDILEGSRGDDILKGGAGRDTMEGGHGDDTFLFTRKAHSTNAAADSITDFSSGEDQIDLSAFNGTLDFVGGAAFSGSAKEVRFTSSGTDRTVQVDLSGNGSADMTILVSSATALVELDFVL